MFVVIGVVSVLSAGCRQDIWHPVGAPGCGGDAAGSLVVVALVDESLLIIQIGFHSAVVTCAVYLLCCKPVAAGGSVLLVSCSVGQATLLPQRNQGFSRA